MEIKNRILKMNDELHLVYGIVLQPDVFDAQGDIISEEEIKEAAHDFLISYWRNDSSMGIMHKSLTDDVEVVESYIAPIDFSFNDEEVMEGSWLMMVKINNSDLWQKVKNGTYNAFSIGGRGIRTPIED